MKTPIIALILPTGDMVHTDFALSLANVCGYLMAKGINFFIVNPRSSSIDKSRNNGVKVALKSVLVTHFCFIDSDQMFPLNVVTELLERDREIVSVASVTRQHPVHFTAKDLAGNYIDGLGKGLISVKSNGLSLMLIKRIVFEELCFPWFISSYQDNLFISEDEHFCHAAHNKGFDILVDCDLSKDIRHIGQHRFGPGDIYTRSEKNVQN